MPYDNKHPEFIRLRDKIRENPKDFIVITGAGLSKPANLPGWEGLLEGALENAERRQSDYQGNDKNEYVARLNKIHESTDELWDKFRSLRSLVPYHAYCQSIKDQLESSAEPPETYEIIWKIGVKGIINFNLDKLAEKAYVQVNKENIECVTCKDIPTIYQMLHGTDQFILKPHGTVSDPSTWVLRRQELTELLGRQLYLQFVSNVYNNRSMLILGYNPDDYAFKFLMDTIIPNIEINETQHFAILNGPSPSLIEIVAKG